MTRPRTTPVPCAASGLERPRHSAPMPNNQRDARVREDCLTCQRIALLLGCGGCVSSCQKRRSNLERAIFANRTTSNASRQDHFPVNIGIFSGGSMNARFGGHLAIVLFVPISLYSQSMT